MEIHVVIGVPVDDVAPPSPPYDKGSQWNFKTFHSLSIYGRNLYFSGVQKMLGQRQLRCLLFCLPRHKYVYIRHVCGEPTIGNVNGWINCGKMTEFRWCNRSVAMPHCAPSKPNSGSQPNRKLITNIIWWIKVVFLPFLMQYIQYEPTFCRANAIFISTISNVNSAKHQMYQQILVYINTKCTFDTNSKLEWLRQTINRFDVGVASFTPTLAKIGYCLLSSTLISSMLIHSFATTTTKHQILEEDKKKTKKITTKQGSKR